MKGPNLRAGPVNCHMESAYLLIGNFERNSSTLEHD